MKDRINRLMLMFDGVIKYTPMLQDHPDWSDEQCVDFARKWHKVAQHRYATDQRKWNLGIPYCRNVPKNIGAE